LRKSRFEKCVGYVLKLHLDSNPHVK
jgi:hypothetical protein